MQLSRWGNQPLNLFTTNTATSSFSSTSTWSFSKEKIPLWSSSTMITLASFSVMTQGNPSWSSSIGSLLASEDLNLIRNFEEFAMLVSNTVKYSSSSKISSFMILISIVLMKSPGWNVDLIYYFWLNSFFLKFDLQAGKILLRKTLEQVNWWISSHLLIGKF